MKKSLSLILTITLAFTLVACSSKKDKEVDVPKKPVEEMFAEAKKLMEKGKLERAIKEYQEIERLYPFSPYATKSRVMEAYSQYKDDEYDKAIDVIDDFVQLNPGNEEVEFMYYLKAICYYDRIQDVKRDQEITVKAQSAFEEVINRFPGTEYAKDSKFKLDLIKDHLAAKEMEVGRFYMRQKNYIAAINRFQAVVKQYDNTEQIEEALYRLVEVNTILGFDDEAVRYATVLGYNYPSGKWYKRAYKLVNKKKENKGGPTFVGRAMDSIGLGSEPEEKTPAPLQSSPMIEGGSWLNENSEIEDNSKPADATGAATPADKAADKGNKDVNAPADTKADAAKATIDKGNENRATKKLEKTEEPQSTPEVIPSPAAQPDAGINEPESATPAENNAGKADSQ